MGVYKEREFKQFLAMIEKSQQGHWVEIARVLGVDPDTITKWKRTPEAQAAMQRGVEHALEQMEQAGKRDWRMWREKLKMLGIEDKVTIKGDPDNPIHTIIEKYGKGGKVDISGAEEAEDGSSKDSA